jgi:hypothetical protein
MASKKDDRNGYQCRSCGHIILTVNKVDGTTPFLIACRLATCQGLMESWFYSVHPVFGKPTYRWIENPDLPHLDLEKIPMSEFDLEEGQKNRRGSYRRL